MADVVNRTTLEYLRSVNTGDYSPASWIINPDLSALAGVPNKYWKVVGDTVVEMSAGEKATKDADLAAADTSADRLGAKAELDRRDLTAIVRLVVDELNSLRDWSGRISLGGQTVLTNVGASYDAISASRGLGVVQVKLTGINSIDWGVAVQKVGTGTQSWQLWNETDGTELGVIDDAGAAAEKTLTATVSSGIPNGEKLLRIRAKSTVAADDPVYHGGWLALRPPQITYAQARNAVRNQVDSI